MSNVTHIFEERATYIGSFLVGRLLPFRQKRAVGPFVFLDHMGPATLDENENFDIPPHPHIGLSTLTYLLEGAVLHRDSLGNEKIIEPGGVNWMTAGKGVVHSERTPNHLRNSKKTIHGLQIWVALPKSMEECDPNFIQIPAKDIQKWETDGLFLKLIAGEALGKKSPVPVYSPMFLLEIRTTEGKIISLNGTLKGEVGLYVFEGAIHCEGNRFDAGKLLISNSCNLCDFTLENGTTLYLFGGEPLPEERFIEWNYVATDKALIEKAKQNWAEGNFPKVFGED